MGNFRESEMFVYIKNYFQKKNYEVYGEVKNCDVVCIKKDNIVVVEMKKDLTIKLITQGIDRQKITEHVYICYRKPKKFTLKKRRETITLCKRLGLGIILVNIEEDEIKTILEPSIKRIVNKNKRNEIKKEIEGIKVNINQGGTNKVKKNTAFREKNILISCALELEGSSSSKDLIKKFSCPQNTNRIMYYNIYGWYEKVSRGIYKLSKKGFEELHSSDFIEVYNYYHKKIRS